MIPDYKKNNLVNLVNSIISGFGGKTSHPHFKYLAKEIKQSTNVILLVIDGMGSDVIEKIGKTNFFLRNKVQNLTSVYPPTTTAAITTIFTGLSPKEHGLLAWTMYFKEVDEDVMILPYKTTEGKTPRKKILPKMISIFNKIKAEKHIIMPQKMLQSPYNHSFIKSAQQWKYRNFNGMLTKIKDAIKSSSKKKYVYAYWPKYDLTCHQFGKESKDAKEHLKKLNLALEKFVKKIRGTNTLLLITADHGFITSGKKRTVELSQHATIRECLSRPVTGEPRSAFCYVYPEKRQLFEKYVKHKLSKYCQLYKSKDLVKKGFFGEGKAHPHLLDRLGDYVLITKENYIFTDTMKHFFKGHHAGLSKEEMTIPLIKVKL
jgi:hypothetical protein